MVLSQDSYQGRQLVLAMALSRVNRCGKTYVKFLPKADTLSMMADNERMCKMGFAL